MKFKILIPAMLTLFLLQACTNSTDSHAPSDALHSSAADGASTQDSGGKWEYYSNSRFGFCLNYPAFLLSPGEEPTNNDGMRFATRDGSSSLAAWGENMLLNETIPLEFEERSQDGFEFDGRKRRVTYKKLGEDWFAVSGFLDEKVIFYRKVIQGEGLTFYEIEFLYPSAEKEQWDAIVDRVLASWPDCNS
ncbi:MAG: hypothetical protein H6581_07430 [Bacteroidia bacterium]|nr:hypothetical protein [Bacteroidia bacterium]